MNRKVKLDPEDRPQASQPLWKRKQISRKSELNIHKSESEIKVMTSVEELFKKRSFAKKNFTLNHNKLLPLVQLSGTEACESIQDVKDLMLKVETCYQTFIKSHDAYLEALEDVTQEKDADQVLETQFKYLNDVEDKFISVRKTFNRFITSTTQEVNATNAANEQKNKALESIPALKLAVLEAIDQYVANKVSAENISKQIKDKSVETLISSVETLQLGIEAEDVRSALGESSRKVIAAMTPFKNAVCVAELDWAQSSADFAVKCCTELSQEVSDYKSVLSKVISAKGRIPPVATPAATLVNQPAFSQLASACPIKLAKVENIDFSGEYRDFANFKRKFETIVVPNRDPADIGLRLRQALPTKHAHLIDNFEPSQWSEMM